MHGATEHLSHRVDRLRARVPHRRRHRHRLRLRDLAMTSVSRLSPPTRRVRALGCARQARRARDRHRLEPSDRSRQDRGPGGHGQARGGRRERHQAPLCAPPRSKAAEPGDVIVVEHHARDDCAGWGGILSLAAKQRGARGNDRRRARARHRRERARPAIPFLHAPRRRRPRGAGSSKRDGTSPITIGGVAVRPGDLVIADGSGVVFVPAEREDAVLDAAEAIAARESAMAEAVREGKPVSEVMGGGLRGPPWERTTE